jgi:hypothetical protein
MFYYDEAIPFTRESWCGRVCASRGISAVLSAEEVSAFDREHEALLNKIVPEKFTIIHRIDARIFQFKEPNYHELDKIAGTWLSEDTEEFEKNIKDFEQLDKEL